MSFALGEWFIRGERRSLPAGEVELVVTNDGTEFHELVVVRTSLDADDLPLAEATADIEQAGEEVIHVEPFSPGKRRRARASLEPGRYVLLCNIAPHYQRGMRTEVTVE